MPDSIATLSQRAGGGLGQPGRLSHINFVPVYNAHRLRRRQREALEQNLRDLKRFKLTALPSRESRQKKLRKSARAQQLESLIQAGHVTPPATYTSGARYPLLPKIGDPPPLIARSRNISVASHATQRESRQKPPSVFLSRSDMADSATRIRDVDGALRLPQIMRSFIPTEGRKLPPRPHAENRSTWIDLTGSKRQQLPNGYKAKSFDIGIRPVTLVTVDYDKNGPKLARKPLPPIHNSTPQTNARKSQPLSQIWKPADSQSEIGDLKGSQAPKHGRSTTTRARSPRTDAGKKLLDSLGAKLSATRNKNIPQLATTKLLKTGGAQQQHQQQAGQGQQGEYFWESGKMRASRNVKKKAESDRHFGNLRSGVILNKLPSDLIGSYKATFESLSYYLGKGSQRPNEENSEVISIPTGRVGEYPDEEYDEDAINPEFIRSITNADRLNDVKMRYVHRSASDTPSMERMPWEENDNGHASEAEMAARNAALASRRRSGNKKVRRLTVKIPRVPGVRQERLIAPPATPVTDFNEQDEDQVLQRHVIANGQSDLPIPMRLSRKDFGSELLGASAQKPWYGMRPLVNEDARILRSEMRPIPEEAKHPTLTEQLVLAHGQLKKRKNNSGQKEILITPFSVKIEDKASEVSVPSASKPSRNDFRSTITKPYTFSYMAAANKKQKTANQLCNEKQAKSKRQDDSWYISSFVAQADQTSEPPAGPRHRGDVTNGSANAPESAGSSLNKGTEPMELSNAEDKGKAGKRRRRIKLARAPQQQQQQQETTAANQLLVPSET